MRFRLRTLLLFVTILAVCFAFARISSVRQVSSGPGYWTYYERKVFFGDYELFLIHTEVRHWQPLMDKIGFAGHPQLNGFQAVRDDGLRPPGYPYPRVKLGMDFPVFGYKGWLIRKMRSEGRTPLPWLYQSEGARNGS